MKHEYLIELLKNNKTVILPNIGAFSNNTNPQHPFLFNEFLKFNDGMIAKHIASKEGISMDAAGETIDKFTNELKNILAEGKEVVIPGIGTLQTKNGKTILEHGASLTTTPTAEKKVEPINETLKQVQSDKPTIEKKPEPIIQKVIVPVVDKKVEPVIEKKPEPIVEKKPEPIVEKVVVPVVEKKTEPIVETLKQVQSDKPVIEKKVEPIIEKKVESKVETLKQVQSDIPVKTKEKPKKKRKLVWILLLLLILGGGGTAGFLYKDELMKMMGMGSEEKTAEKKSDKKEENEKTEESKSNEEIPITEEPTSDTTTSETPVTEEIVEEPKEEIKVEQVVENNKTAPLSAENSTPGNYYIIVGCFQEPTNAENMISKISAASMTPTNVGTFNGLAHIAAGSASDLQSAIQQATSIRGTFSKSWILKR